jgi:DNA-binding XRE family transcriptional regulator
MDGRAQRLRQARIDRGHDTAAAAAEAFGWSRNTYAANENGNAPFSMTARVRRRWWAQKGSCR